MKKGQTCPIPSKLIQLAFEEDLGKGDITTQALFAKKSPKVEGIFLAKEALIVAGLPIVQAVFKKINPKLKFKILKKEGSDCEEGDEIAIVTGSAASLLTAERTALNFLQQLSGVATQTYLFTKMVEGTGAKILDTRKTLPGWRNIQKYAVRMGGGFNHRIGLFDAYLIKDNHLALYGSISEAIQAVRKHNEHISRAHGTELHPKRNNLIRGPKGPSFSRDKKKRKIEVEVTNLPQLEEALTERPDWILLDNMTLEDMRLACIINEGKTILEASGNVNLENVRAVAETGVDYISVGALTHSAAAVDISLEIN